MNFTAMDVETANPDLASICQIGMVTFRDGIVVDNWQSLVNPEADFHWMNTSIHGIDERAVQHAPGFQDIYDEVVVRMQNAVVATHTTFDRVAISRAVHRYQLQLPDCTWLDTAKVTRRAWTTLTQTGYGLKDVAAMLSISFHHHDALEDARVTGEILLRAIQTTGIDLAAWPDQVRLPMGSDGGVSGKITRRGDPEGALYGEILVFTGALSIPRRQAADLAAKAGCQVAASVTSSTTLLVVGEQDIHRLAEHEMSSKHRKAEELIAKGQAIRILSEGDFQRLAELGS